jgi:hypothetical protein
MTEAIKKLTKGGAIAADLAALLRARNSVIWVVSREESRIERHLVDAALDAKFIPRTWDASQGPANIDGSLFDLVPQVSNYDGVPERVTQAEPNINAIVQRATDPSQRGRDCWIFRDLPIWLQGAQGAVTLRALRNASRRLPTVGRTSAQSIIVLSPDANVPPELSGIPVVEFPLPDEAEIGEILDEAVEGLHDDPPGENDPAGKIPFLRSKVKEKLQNGFRSAAIKAAVGLSGDEVASTFARSLVQTASIDPVAVAAEKKRVISKEKLIQWFDPDPRGLDAVGGLNALKGWLKSRAVAWSPEARAYGLPLPKGILLLGVPGCGKSLVGKAIGTAYQCPLIRFDPNGLKGKFVGESEQNLRRILQLFQTIGRCVIWIDELEKALAGATQGAADGGVSSDALGTLLTWMQDRTSEAFVVATCNDVEKLPPELLRKGRFDEIFSVDLPTAQEREEILAVTLRQHGRGNVEIDIPAVAAGCADFTGSEVASLVAEALFRAFADGGREIVTDDLVVVSQSIVPLAKTMADKINYLRKFQRDGRARPATTPLAAVPAVAPAVRKGRNLDL